MTNLQIKHLIESDFFEKKYGPAKLVETHISWVVLARDFVFKIKKPHHYSFLDFSTLERRKHFCERELELNRRLAADMYLSVVPVYEKEGQLSIEEGNGKIIDYAVKMKRMDESRQMNLLLIKEEVTFNHLDELAKIIGGFHKKAIVIKKSPSLSAMQEDFADILNVKGFVKTNIGRDGAATIESAVHFSAEFLQTHAKRIAERHQRGFTIDGHGDLYSQNIFLPKNELPVVFDCIEFSDHFRELDVLNELAFFCMDLEYYGKEDLAKYFLEKYNQENTCLYNQEDNNLFQYYKIYRANVRAKVGALKAMQVKDKVQLKKQLDFVNDYLALMKRYLAEMAVTQSHSQH